MTILPLSFSPLFFHSIFIFPSKNHLSLSILLPPPSLHLARTHGHGQSLPPPPASSSLLASCSDTRAQAAAARPPTVPCRGTVSWRCSDLAARASGSACREESARRRAARKRRAKTARKMEPPPEPRGAAIFGSVPSLLLQSPGFPGLRRWSRSRN